MKTESDYAQKSLQSWITCVTIPLLILALIAVAYIAVNFGTWDCQRRGESMGVNWMYYPGRGCYIQQPGGSWMPLDSNRTYYQP
jgi:hypothetical protein